MMNPLLQVGTIVFVRARPTSCLFFTLLIKGLLNIASCFKRLYNLNKLDFANQNYK